MVRANEIAYAYIKARILDGTFRPAQRLVEAQLVEDIGVSRNTIKKALMLLSREGLVTIEDNKGATIRSLDLEEVAQYYEIRIALEKIVVQHAAKNITESDLDEMASLLDKMKSLSAVKDFDTYSECNRQFHNIIYVAARKPIIADIIQNIKTQLKRFQIKTMLVPGRADRSLEEHEAILNALRNHDAVVAEKVIVTHVSHVVETITEYKNLFF
ncbi:GntR family transcriptional regulator [Oscillospiraceae bacterium LTW-04]|nr:GntR family transcriptional regulator [Oscillospiraceae bacterium MB24-C1]